MRVQRLGHLRHVFRRVRINNYHGWEMLCEERPRPRYDHLPGEHCPEGTPATCLWCIVADATSAG